jgi:hypothetical protein
MFNQPTNKLNAWSRVLRGKLTVPQPVKKIRSSSLVYFLCHINSVHALFISWSSILILSYIIQNGSRKITLLPFAFAFGYSINFCIYAMLRTRATFSWPILYNIISPPPCIHLSSPPYVPHAPPIRIRNVCWQVSKLPLVNSLSPSCLRRKIIQAQQTSYAFLY